MAWWAFDKRTGRWVQSATRPPGGGLKSRPARRATYQAQARTDADERAGTDDPDERAGTDDPDGRPHPSWQLIADDAARPPSWLLDAARPRSCAGAAEVALIHWRRAPVTVRVTDTARDQIVAHAAARNGWTEEGGVLIGVSHQPGEILVTDAGGPGDRARRTPGSYGPDPAADESFVRALETQLGGQVLKVGGWHSHNSGHTQPSDADLQAMVHHLNRSHAQDGRWRSGWLEIIVTPRSTSELRASGDHLRYVSTVRPDEFTAWWVRPDGTRYLCEPATLS